MKTLVAAVAGMAMSVGLSGQKVPVSDFTALDYLESTGTQVIDTGIRYGLGTCLEQRLNGLTRPASASLNTSEGAVDKVDSTVERFHCAFTSSGQISVFHLNSSSSVSFGNLFNKWTDLVIDASRLVAAMGGVEANLGGTYVLDQSQHCTIWLFGRNSLTESLREYASIRSGQTLILNQGTDVVRNLIPCRRNADNELGMYDLVEQEFHSNAGTGTFVAGPEGIGFPEEIPPQTFEGAPVTPHPVIMQVGVRRVEGRDYTLSWADNGSPGVGTVTITGAGDFASCQPLRMKFLISNESVKIPSRYQQVQFLESTTGGHQVLDTGVHPKVGTEFMLTAQIMDFTNDFEVGKIDKLSDGKLERFHIGGLVGGRSLACGLGTFGGELGFNVDFGWNTYSLKYAEGRGYLTFNGNVASVALSATFREDNSTLWLFGRNSNVDELRMYKTIRVMEAQIREGDDLVHRFIPCRTKEADSVPGFYDVVGKRFYENTGNGRFIVGPDVGKPKTGFMVFIK